MDVRIYTIFDKVAEEAGPFFTAKNDGVAGRQFRQLMASNGVERPEEFKLLFLGSFDSSSCKATFEVAPVEIFLSQEKINERKLVLVPNTMNGGD